MQFNDVPVAMQVDEWNVNKEGGGRLFGCLQSTHFESTNGANYKRSPISPDEWMKIILFIFFLVKIRHKTSLFV